MKKNIQFSIIAALGLTIAFTSCSKEVKNNETLNSFRPAIDYSVLKDTTNYSTAFVDGSGVSTVDLSGGNDRLNMFKAIDSYCKSGVTAPVSSTSLVNMFYNQNTPFTDPTYTYLNNSIEQIGIQTATSVLNRELVINKIESFFNKMALASASNGQIASQGQAGVLTATTGSSASKYLVDANGIEWAQVISKSLIGAYQVDLITNVLLNDNSLNANNLGVISNKNYSVLEHNWDEAYATLTTRPVYGSAATTSSSGESFTGSYIWEYNPSAFPTIHKAYLIGRAAIVNGDKATLQTQATLLKTAFQKAIVNAAIAYLGKVNDNAGIDDARRAHAYGEGVGFIYSLRFCNSIGGNEAFSDELLNDIHFNSTGLWELTNNQVTTAINKIKTKFGV